MDGVYYDAKGNLLGIDNEEEKTRHDLISRCELFNKLALVPAKDDVNEYASKVYSIIQQMPAVDAVEVVRCKDCKYKKAGRYGKTVSMYSTCKYSTIFHTDYDFCSCGERSGDEN